ncbi:MAG TPA: exosortase/archaeosortase family protein [Verrucomicrobiae bacterium]|jgi:exosortase C (VPDSG-CTERM-specific)|nr:exosortase/archaeosortase family protein [Verrucomicrobiae bacterium]
MESTIYTNPPSETRLVLRRHLNWLALETILLCVCFGRPLLDLLRFTLHSELFSYIPLVPAIGAYLIWTQKEEITTEVRPFKTGAVIAFIIGAGIAAGWWMGIHGGWKPARQDYLTMMTLSFVFFFWGACFGLLGWKIMRDAAFPFAFLIFAVPMPTAFVAGIDAFFQITSAWTAQLIFSLVGTATLRHGLQIDLPGVPALLVGPECSGIHSTLVLFMTALVAGYLFLRWSWTRAIFVIAVVPLAILRNGFRIWVIGELCVHISPAMIDSPIHRKGGPLFFALALIPFFLLLAFLRRRDFNKSEKPVKE